MTERTAPSYDFYPTPPAGGPTAPPPAPAVGVLHQPGPPALAPSAPVFGAAVNQFGTPIGTPGATLPAAYSAAAPQPASRGVHVPRWVWRFVAPLAVLVVLGLFGVGRLGFLAVVHRPLEAPSTLAGLPVAAEGSSVRASLSGVVAMAQAESDGNGDDVLVEVYSDEVSQAVMLVAGRGEDDTSPLEEFTADGLTVSTHGDVTCGVDATRGNTTCAQVGDGRTVVVIMGGTDPVAASGIAAEAFTALG